MSKATFVVPVADLEQLGRKTVTCPIPEGWLRQTLADSEATPQGGDGELDVELSKSGRDVMVRGRARVTVTMPCVVTLDPLTFELTPEIFLLLSPAPGAGAARKDRPRKGAGPARDKAPRDKASGPRGTASAREGWDDAGAELDPETAARDTFDGEKVVLDDFLREFILLELPMYPRRPDLPSEESPAIAPPSGAAAEAEARIDPRLAPLAALASRLRETTKKE